MRTILLLTIYSAACWAGSVLGTWEMDRTRSRFVGPDQPQSLTVRIEPHAKGRVFTLDRLEADGRTASSSTILYFDGAPGEFQDFSCSGTQSSRWSDRQSVEIRRVCSSGESIWRVRESVQNAEELTIEVTRTRRGGSNIEWRVVLKKQKP
jgi:hypothetical protein